MTTLHTHNQRRKRAYRKSLGFTIGKNRWKGKMRRQMQKELRHAKRTS